MLNGEEEYDYAGVAVATGDLNGDGVDDVIIGAPNAGRNGAYYGHGVVYVVFGKKAEEGGFDESIDLSELDGANGFVLNGEEEYDYAGGAVTTGDVNGDGVDDVVIGAPYAGGNGADYDHGVVYVVFGKTAEEGGFAGSIDLSGLDGTDGFVLSAPASGPLFGELLNPFWTQGEEMAGADTEQGNPNLFIWDVQNQDWAAVGDLASQSLAPGQGFLFYLFSDDNGPGEPGDAGFPKPLSTLELNGPVTFNAGEITAVTGLGHEQFFLAGNPYGKAVDWELLTRVGLSETVYVFDPSINRYRLFNGEVGDSNFDGVLAPFQGFFVQGFNEAGEDAEGSLTFTEAAIVPDSVSVPLFKENQSKARALGLKAQTGGRTSQAWVSFQQGGEPGRDAHDGLTLAPLDTTYLQLFTIAGENQALTINALSPEVEEELRLPLGLTGRGIGETAELTFTGLEAFEGWAITLIDTETGREYPVEVGSRIPLDIGTGRLKALPATPVMVPVQQKISASEVRYELVLVPAEAVSNDPGSELPTEVALDQNYPNPFNPATVISYQLPARSAVRLEVFSIIGQKVATLVDLESQSAGIHEVRFDASALASGMYLYRLETVDAVSGAGTTVFTRKMMLIK
ncbi:MAG: T9SS type A sorting domain-containing protein [Bacteroidota bacterium]